MKKILPSFFEGSRFDFVVHRRRKRGITQPTWEASVERVPDNIYMLKQSQDITSLI